MTLPWLSPLDKLANTAKEPISPRVQEVEPEVVDEGEFSTNDVEEGDEISYVGKETASATWLVMKIDTTSGTVIRYASLLNNPLVATYAAAWAARATTLVYGTYSEAL